MLSAWVLTSIPRRSDPPRPPHQPRPYHGANIAVPADIAVTADISARIFEICTRANRTIARSKNHFWARTLLPAPPAQFQEKRAGTPHVFLDMASPEFLGGIPRSRDHIRPSRPIWAYISLVQPRRMSAFCAWHPPSMSQGAFGFVPIHGNPTHNGHDQGAKEFGFGPLKVEPLTETVPSDPERVRRYIAQMPANDGTSPAMPLCVTRFSMR